MFSEDDKPEKPSFNISGNRSVKNPVSEVKKAFGYPEQGTTPPKLLPTKDWFKFYLMNDAGIRKFYGFGIEGTGDERKLVIADLKRVESLEPETKSVLRELWRELR